MTIPPWFIRRYRKIRFNSRNFTSLQYAWVGYRIARVMDQVRKTREKHKEEKKITIPTVKEEVWKLIQAVADEEPGVPSEIDGDSSCYWCGAFLGGGEEHDSDCVWESAKYLLKEKEEQS